MLEYLKRPCPILISNRSKFLLALGLAVFVFFFVITFQPFGILDHTDRSKLFVSAGYSIITFVLSLIYTFSWNGYAAKRDVNVTVGMSIFVAFILITLIGVSNFFFGLYVHYPAYIIQETLPVFFLRSLLITHAVGLFPFIFITFYFETKLRHFHGAQSSTLTTGSYELTKDVIIIEGDGQDQSLAFSSEAFRFAKASGNYVEFYIMQDGSPKKELQRITLSKLEEQFAEHAIPTMKTHRSYIVNLSMIESVNGNAQGYALKLNGLDDKIPVSRYKLEDFNRVMKSTMIDSRH